MNTHGAQDLRARTATRVVAAVAIGAGLLLSVIGAAVSSSAAQAASPATKGSLAYSATATIPVPLPSKFAGSAGGDGWAVAANATEIFNVFHHHADPPGRLPSQVRRRSVLGRARDDQGRPEPRLRHLRRPRPLSQSDHW